MKTYKKYLITTAFLVALSSCQLTNVDDIKIRESLVSSNAISSPTLAENALVGAHRKSLADFFYITDLSQEPGKKGIELNKAGTDGRNENNYNVSSDPLYTSAYSAINALNYIIQQVPNITDEDFNTRREEILGMAYFLRAHNYFLLFRRFSQFWDTSSEYGLVIHTEPVESIIIKARSTVAETYELIFNDLDLAIAKAPHFSASFYASKEAAKALKAKVLMYKGEAGDFSKAAMLCDQIIQSNHFSLEGNFNDVFINNFESTEAILVNFWDEKLLHANFKHFQFSFLLNVDPIYDALMPISDPRRPFTIKNGFRPFLPKKVAKYPRRRNAYNIYFRLAEIYLIKAECLVRSNAPLPDAQGALDVVRARVGLPSTNASSADELLEDIRIEKALELGFELGQSWFDIIRYHIHNNLDAFSVKPTLNSINQFISGIPFKSIEISDGVVKQNPGYLD